MPHATCNRTAIEALQITITGMEETVEVQRREAEAAGACRTPLGAAALRMAEGVLGAAAAAGGEGNEGKYDSVDDIPDTPALPSLGVAESVCPGEWREGQVGAMPFVALRFALREAHSSPVRCMSLDSSKVRR